MKNNGVIRFIVLQEQKLAAWKAQNGLNILRISLGLVFIWFGLLKFFPGLSPAEVIAGKTMYKLTFGLLTPHMSLPMLAVWECTIGFGLVFKKWLSLTLLLLYLQMAGTFLPLFFFPHETFGASVFIPTLLGQYIIKNIVLMSGGIVIGAAAISSPANRQIEQPRRFAPKKRQSRNRRKTRNVELV